MGQKEDSSPTLDPSYGGLEHGSTYEERAKHRESVLGVPRSVQLTAAEVGALELSTELWNAVTALPRQHPSDGGELCLALHRIQHIIMIRPVRRAHPDIFYVEENPEGTPMVDLSKEYRP